MRRFFLLLAVGVVLGGPLSLIAQTSTQNRPVAANAALTNSDVVKMTKAGLSEDIIANAIQSSAKKAFDLSADGLVQLKLAGVSDRVILMMQGKPSVAPPASAAAPPSTTSAATESKPKPPAARTVVSRPTIAGIYELVDGKTFTRITTSRFTTKAGGRFKSGLTLGLTKQNQQAVVSGQKATYRASAKSQFYLYSSPESGLSGSIFNPELFVLAKLTTSGSDRTFVLGEYQFDGHAVTGIRQGDYVHVRLRTLENLHEYTVIPESALEPGEYAFIRVTDAGYAATEGVLFDFGVDP